MHSCDVQRLFLLDSHEFEALYLFPREQPYLWHECWTSRFDHQVASPSEFETRLDRPGVASYPRAKGVASDQRAKGPGVCQGISSSSVARKGLLAGACPNPVHRTSEPWLKDRLPWLKERLGWVTANPEPCKKSDLVPCQYFVLQSGRCRISGPFMKKWRFGNIEKRYWSCPACPSIRAARNSTHHQAELFRPSFSEWKHAAAMYLQNMFFPCCFALARRDKRDTRPTKSSHIKVLSAIGIDTITTNLVLPCSVENLVR